jgi:hypothetical protein
VNDHVAGSVKDPFSRHGGGTEKWREQKKILVQTNTGNNMHDPPL